MSSRYLWSTNFDMTYSIISGANLSPMRLRISKVVRIRYDSRLRAAVIALDTWSEYSEGNSSLVI